MRFDVYMMILLCLGTTECQEITESLKQNIFDIVRFGNVETGNFQKNPVDPNTVTYYLYTPDNSSVNVQLNSENLDILKNQTCKKIVFIIHGWIGSRNAVWYGDMTNIFLKNYKYCVIQVDWHEPAGQLYPIAAYNAYYVSTYITELIIKIHDKCQIGFDRFLPIGFSLGGHIVGFIGKQITSQTGNQLERVIALDPAGPLYQGKPNDSRLSKTDAKVVVVIHTNGGIFGYLYSCGTIDYFANGGSYQPGCLKIDIFNMENINSTVFCSHARAPLYFVEAIASPNLFIAKRCEWGGLKCDNVTVSLGNLTTTLEGTFYFETNKEKPFGKQ